MSFTCEELGDLFIYLIVILFLYLDSNQPGTQLRHTSVIVSFLNKGLAKNTLTNYIKSASIWVQFLSLHGFITHTSQPMTLWSRMSVTQQLHIIISYIIWLYEEQGWATRKISQNISGVRHFIRGHLLGLEAFNHESVTLALKATQSDPRTISLLRETKKRLPVTTEMVMWFKERSWQFGRVLSREDIDNRMIFLGVAIGLTFLRRVSEYTRDQRSDHTILSDDVHFISKHDPPHVIVAFDIPNSSLTPQDISSLRFIFRTSKTDQGGRGTYLFLQSNNAAEYELIHCFYHWCMISGQASGEPFLSRVYLGLRKVLRPRMINDALKYIADSFGLKHVRNSFTSHSLRIGGATALIASGTDRETIQRIGGWSVAPTSSDSIYELNTPRANSNLWSVLNSHSNKHVSINDVVSIIPPSQSIK